MTYTPYQWPLVVMVDHRDGSTITEGERIRYKQKPGGFLPPNREWTYGTARKYVVPEWMKDYAHPHQDPDELYLFTDDGDCLRVAHHLVERVAMHHDDADADHAASPTDNPTRSAK